jgi:hypothetical protein
LGSGGTGGAGGVGGGTGGQAGEGGSGGTGGQGPVADGGTPDVQTVTSPFVSIGIGAGHACGVRADGTISCLGSNARGQASPPPGLYSAVVAGAQHTCAAVVDHLDQTKDGLWVCWGDNSSSQLVAPPIHFNEVAAGGRHNCGRGPAGITCWGDDSFGQSTPPAFPANVFLSELAAGANHTCAAGKVLDSAGAVTGQPYVKCWGDDSKGQSSPPADAAGDFLAAGGDHTCASGFVNAIRCWGDNAQAQSTSPPGVIRTLSVASGHSCGMPFGGYRDGEIFCWGTGWGASRPSPPDGPFLKVVAGDYLNCGFPNDSTQPVVCWGQSDQPWF